MPHGQEQHPEQHEVNDGVINVCHQKIPPLSAYGDQIKKHRKELDSIANNQGPGCQRCPKKDAMQRDGAQARLKQAQPGKPEQLQTVIMIDEAVRTAEIRSFQKRVNKIDETQDADGDPKNINRQGMGGLRERLPQPREQPAKQGKDDRVRRARRNQEGCPPAFPRGSCAPSQGFVLS